MNRDKTRKHLPQPLRKLAERAKRKLKTAVRATVPYAGFLALVVFAAAWLHSAPLAWLGLGATLGVAGDRLREHLGWMRKGSRLARRRRQRHLGPATFRELGRKVSAAAIRRDARGTRPNWPGRTRTMPATEAGIPICTVTRGKLR